jgi:hypothetical protein
LEKVSTDVIHVMSVFQSVSYATMVLAPLTAISGVNLHASTAVLAVLIALVVWRVFKAPWPSIGPRLQRWPLRRLVRAVAAAILFALPLAILPSPAERVAKVLQRLQGRA